MRERERERERVCRGLSLATVGFAGRRVASTVHMTKIQVSCFPISVYSVGGASLHKECICGERGPCLFVTDAADRWFIQGFPVWDVYQ